MKAPAIGIDLGTTYSALAAINPAGKPEIVPNKEGERITASAVYFQPGGSVLVGQLAVDAAQGDPGRVVRWIKRKMGDAAWSFSVDGEDYSPVDISALILKKVRQDAEAVLGQIRHAVVTVPAYFDETRRKATMDAAAKAGLELLRIINEPTAAALAYAADGRVRGTVLIYDFGGGTFDVSIVNIESAESVSVLSSEGDHELGGYDLDLALAAHLDSLFKESFGVRLLDDQRPAIVHRTIAEAERAKRRLSSMMTAPSIALNWGGHVLNASVDRVAFERIIKDFVVRTEMLIDNALSAAKVTPEQIDAVILVGGSTRIPMVQRLLRDKFHKDPLKHVNPDEAVALGAAIQSAVIMQGRGLLDLPGTVGEVLKRTRLQDVTNHSFGTISIGSAFGRQCLRNSIIIPKNTPIPCSKTDEFQTIVAGQTDARCQITQGEDEDPEFVNTITEGVLELPPGRPAGCTIRVTYSYDANGRMACEFLDVESGRQKRFELDVRGPQTHRKSQSDERVNFDDLVIE